MAKSKGPATAAEMGAICGLAAALAAADAPHPRSSLDDSLRLSRRRSRMVEISLSGSGEGLQAVTPGAYSTEAGHPEGRVGEVSRRAVFAEPAVKRVAMKRLGKGKEGMREGKKRLLAESLQPVEGDGAPLGSVMGSSS